MLLFFNSGYGFLHDSFTRNPSRKTKVVKASTQPLRCSLRTLLGKLDHFRCDLKSTICCNHGKTRTCFPICSLWQYRFSGSLTPIFPPTHVAALSKLCDSILLHRLEQRLQIRIWLDHLLSCVESPSWRGNIHQAVLSPEFIKVCLVNESVFHTQPYVHRPELNG